MPYRSRKGETKIMTYKHTPEPWEANHEECDPKPHPNDPGFFTINAVILTLPGPVADTMNRDSCISPEQDRANAMLIAAAPKMLETIVTMYRHLEYNFSGERGAVADRGWWDEDESNMKELASVIEAATGEKP